MSDTPRTDQAYQACVTIGFNGIIDPLIQCSALLERKLTDALAKIAELEQVSGHLCPKCGWAMKFPDEPCRCELESVVKWIASQRNLFFAECSQAEEIVAKCNEVLKKTESTPPKFRCADRDDGCGHCERSEPHEHPDEQQGDECDRRGGKVTCEVVK